MRRKAVYSPRTLFSGAVIGKNASDMYVGVPNHYKNARILILYKGNRMIIEDWNSAEAYRTFEDKWGRDKTYTLGYFKFITEKERIAISQAREKVVLKQQSLI